jgi:proline iminopeptidase
VHPAIEPYASGMVGVGDGDTVYWETCGNPDGKAAVVLHGGPGSGRSEWSRRYFDPDAYRIVLFDQRNCGRSTPHASDPATDLSSNTTASLVADVEALRAHLGVERWLVLGGSWGSTLALAYAEAHTDRVSELVLHGVTTGRHAELDWLFRGGLARFFPEQWARLEEAAAPDRRGEEDVVETYHRLLGDPDADVRKRAAGAWCLWESATPHWPPETGLSRRFRDPRYAVAFARLVTHYVRHDCFLEDGALLRGADVLADTPGVLVTGRFDFQAPIEYAWTLRRAWPRADLVVVDDAGHTSDAIDAELVSATRRFAS